jgi:hypothetical protein
VVPIAVLTALVAMGLAIVAAGRTAAPLQQGALTGIAAFEYAMALEVALRTPVPATRRTLQLDVIGVLAVLAAVLAAANVRYLDAA